MSIRLPTLDNEVVNELLELQQTVPFIPANNRHRHLGENKGNNLSNYRFSRWYEWNRKQRDDFKKAFPTAYAERSLVGWFLQLPANVGCIDKMTQWEGRTDVGSIIAYALQDQQAFLLNNRQVTLGIGEGIGFQVSEVHEIKRTPKGQLWACIMIPGPISRIVTR